VVLNFRDVTERRQLTEQLRHQALHDPLTGLANRALFRNLVQHALAGSERHFTPSAVLYLDLDGFKQVNDRLGHAAGDQLLVEVALRLRGSLRSEDTAARLGGDEFAVLLDRADQAAAVHVAQRVLSSLVLPLEIRGERVEVGGSLGVAVSGEGVESAEELIRHADLAMYFAKEEGKGGVRVFEPAMQARVRRRLELESDLRRALEHKEFTLHYQPILGLRSGKVAAVEALVRWEEPDRAGSILPGEFIPLAEETGLIVPLGRWVLNTACHQVHLWQSHFAGEPPLALSINLSAKQFWDPALAEDVAAALAASGLEAGSLTLEIAEPVLMRDVEATRERLLALKRLGVRVAIDDFGGGQSALFHLRRFPVDAIKIDKVFVDGVGGGSSDEEVTQGIIELAHKLSLQTVAEGIEATDQIARLDRMGCQLGQGFSLARPMDADGLEAFLRGAPLAAADAARQAAVD
jgi:diguanylate cyclase (GGDEF)-like protein